MWGGTVGLLGVGWPDRPHRGPGYATRGVQSATLSVGENVGGFLSFPCWPQSWLVSIRPDDPVEGILAAIREFDHRMLKLAVQLLTLLALAANR